jgi:hypothetical protein
VVLDPAVVTEAAIVAVGIEAAIGVAIVAAVGIVTGVSKRAKEQNELKNTCKGGSETRPYLSNGLFTARPPRWRTWV